MRENVRRHHERRGRFKNVLLGVQFLIYIISHPFLHSLQCLFNGGRQRSFTIKDFGGFSRATSRRRVFDIILHGLILGVRIGDTRSILETARHLRLLDFAGVFFVDPKRGRTLQLVSQFLLQPPLQFRLDVFELFVVECFLGIGLANLAVDLGTPRGLVRVACFVYANLKKEDLV